MTTPTPTLPEALRLADELDAEAGRITQYTNRPGDLLRELAADELRRMHSEVTTLQAELAAMRAGGDPVAEMVPCHTPSGKRVAVISRFQHLPIGTKLYTHPKPAAQDAERPFPAIVDGLLWLCVKEHGAIKPLESASALPIPRSWKSSMLDAARKQGANHD